GVVNVTDLSVLATNWGRTSATHAQGDANSDGTINIYDLSILASQWGQTITPTPTAVNVINYGATGNGTTDDTAAIGRALSAAVSSTKTVYIPAGTYKISSITVPDGLTITGAGQTASWLKGHIDFGSNQYFSDLKIGDSGVSAIHNINGASTTTFERVHFRGGGGAAYTPVVFIGEYYPSAGASNHITLKDCEIERNLGTETTAWFEGGYNDVTIWVGKLSPVDSVTFDGCHFGVSNGQGGHDIGSPRMDMEVYIDGDHSDFSVGWSNITVRNSIFEAADGQTLDFSDASYARGNGVLVENNVFMGGGYKRANWANTLVLEEPMGVIIRNNTFYRGGSTGGAWGNSLQMSNTDQDVGGPNTSITGNTFDLNHDNGIATGDDWPIVLNGLGNTFSGNTIDCNYGTLPIILLDNAQNNVVTGNTFNIGSRSLFGSVNGSSANTTSPNTVN
ncbi:MAG TPA: glycosyl hydrolase family 28-related protein, partial [Patescibacteria group bacterium]|nr:glycosyl hydrolase family 28-related protein [Patescibacteria group bacterium]